MIIDSGGMLSKVARPMTMLSDFLNEKQIKPEDVVKQSHAMEKRHIKDRESNMKRANARANKKPYAELNLEKSKPLGRGVSTLALNRAIAGTPMPRLVRKKIARAVNAVLQVKKQEAVEWRKLFGDVKSQKQPSKKK